MSIMFSKTNNHHSLLQMNKRNLLQFISQQIMRRKKSAERLQSENLVYTRSNLQQLIQKLKQKSAFLQQKKRGSQALHMKLLTVKKDKQHLENNIKSFIIKKSQNISLIDQLTLQTVNSQQKKAIFSSLMKQLQNQQQIFKQYQARYKFTVKKQHQLRQKILQQQKQIQKRQKIMNDLRQILQQQKCMSQQTRGLSLAQHMKNSILSKQYLADLQNRDWRGFQSIQQFNII